MAPRKGAPVRYAVVGLGHIAQVAVLPAFAPCRSGIRVREGLAYERTVNGRVTRKRIGKRDQFAPELLYFSDCILKNRVPEPSGEEGLQDVRIVQALYQSARTGKAVALPRFIDAKTDAKRPSGRQRITKPGVRKPALVKVQSASET